MISLPNAKISSETGRERESSGKVRTLFVDYLCKTKRAHIFHAAPSHPPQNKGIPIDLRLFR